MSITFLTTQNPTAFGAFDADTVFQTDADKMVTFVLQKLGEPVLSVELPKKIIWSNLEEATLQFGAMMLEYQAKSNLATLLGSPTGSSGSINLTNLYLQQNLEFLQRQAEAYIDQIGLGPDSLTASGSISLILQQQDYDLYTDLKDDNGVPLYNYQPSGSQYKMKILEVFQAAPIQYVFNSNFASNMVAAGLPVESYIPDTRFYVLPLFEDVLRASMLKASQKIRRSNYSYKISGRKIRIFPTPVATTFFTQKLWVKVGFVNSVAPGVTSTLSGAFSFASGSIQDDKLYGVSNPANVPYQSVPYNSINAWGKNWIKNYCLALCKETLGLIRSKFSSVPAGIDAELKLNGDELVAQAREDKTKLTDTLREYLDSLTYDKLAELEALKSDNILKQLQNTPFPPNYSVRLWD